MSKIEKYCVRIGAVKSLIGTDVQCEECENNGKANNLTKRNKTKQTKHKQKQMNATQAEFRTALILIPNCSKYASKI